ncbi:Wall-associated proteinase [Escovopsis weberi]|uniref:Wall-associated proteinase n=1 Tax=Escovopsis weberi TaxID=150374 RepID=A0A0M9VUK0_ESCWE|nr:Wall-associated proteinase [Escovopsis weberi]
MSGVAALWNVYDQDGPTDPPINLYYNTGTAQLAVSIRSSTEAPDSGKGFAAAENDHPGVILNPSEIACGVFRGFQIVIAATEPMTASGTRPTTNQISAVSPVYMGLAQTSLQNAKVSMSASKANAWVYFLDGTAEHGVRLKEFNYTTGGVTSYLEGADIKLNSSLASWYDEASDERFVIYQRYSTSNTDLKEFNVTTRDNSPKAGTSVAVTNHKGIVYLYYTDSQSNLRRVMRRDNQWGTSAIVKNSPPVGNGQITVATANGLNHIFYMARDDSMAKQDFEHVHDPIEE